MYLFANVGFLDSYILLRFKITRSPFITIQLVVMSLSHLTLFRFIIMIIIIVISVGAMSLYSSRHSSAILHLFLRKSSAGKPRDYPQSFSKSSAFKMFSDQT